jgi:predicted aminopeptidase
MKQIFIAFVLGLCASCAKVGYVVEQGFGQLDLLASGRNNEVVLDDPSVSEELKQKVILIEKYKDHFYSYLSEEPSKIYNKTVILKEKAVTHLVIVSPPDKIQALEECFPIAGCFPYLGFYKLASAKKYAQKHQEKGNVTFIRPVYAYSTLGRFNDPILSSFFEYDDVELAELIFHELFHTVFFIKNEVQLNENLANFFSRQMVLNYFSGNEEVLTKYEKETRLGKALAAQFVKAAHELNQKYNNLSLEQIAVTRDSYLENNFMPKILELCREFGLSAEKCTPAREKWNNARFAAMLTYEEEGPYFDEDFKKSQLTLLQYLGRLRSRYKEFSKQKSYQSFFEYYKGL